MILEFDKQLLPFSCSIYEIPKDAADSGYIPPREVWTVQLNPASIPTPLCTESFTNDDTEVHMIRFSIPIEDIIYEYLLHFNTLELARFYFDAIIADKDVRIADLKESNPEYFL